MCPLPKRKHSRSRSRKRRTHQGLSRITPIACSHCGAPRIPHRVCPKCGYYADKPIVSPEGAS
ncbi:MAG: 50S ribosomal protein L32 [bacterium]|nr:50S ribosomal protein L32 [bacterium]